MLQIMGSQPGSALHLLLSAWWGKIGDVIRCRTFVIRRSAIFRDGVEFRQFWQRTWHLALLARNFGLGCA